MSARVLRHLRWPIVGALWVPWLVAGAGIAAGMPPPELGLRRSAYFYLDYDRNAVPDAIVGFGLPSDKGLVADFDGDTLSDLAVYRAGFWYISLYNDAVVTRVAALGTASDIPLAADVNGDGLSDLVLYRPSSGTWYVNFSQAGAFDGTADWIRPYGGGPADRPVVGDFDGDGRADRAIYRQGFWYIDLDWNGTADLVCAFGGGAGDVPLAADFDGDGVADLVIFRAGTWYVDTDCNGTVDQVHHYGAAGDLPLVGDFGTANSLFVNASAAPGGPGTQRAPMTTVAAAIAQAPPGSVIRIATGTYPAPLVIANRGTPLTLAGAGWTATHLTGGGGPGSDALTIVHSRGITLRNLRVASPNQRGVIVQGSTVTLDRVSTVGNYSHGVLAVGYLGVSAVLTVGGSRLDESQVGTGLRLEGGLSATLMASSVSGTGTAPQIPPLGGRGIEVLGTSALEIVGSTVSDNYDGGILVDNLTAAPGSTTVRDSLIERNGTNGIIYGHNTQGLVTGNSIVDNGQRGSPGAVTGFNGIEILSGWNGPSMAITGNTIAGNTGNGVLVGSGTVRVVGNAFDNNWLAMTIFNDPNIAANVTIEGNTFDTQPPTTEQTGIFIQETWGNPTVKIGGSGSGQRNVFRNYLGRPAIACHIGTAFTTCPLAWNQFVNSQVPVQKCNCTP